MSNVYSTPADASLDQDQVGRNPVTHTDLSAGRNKSYAPNPYWSRSSPEPPVSPVLPTPAPEPTKTKPKLIAVDSVNPSPTADVPVSANEPLVTVATAVPVSLPTETTQMVSGSEPDTDMDQRFRLICEEIIKPVHAQLTQLSQQLARPQAPVSIPDELTKQLGGHIIDWLPQLPNLLRPTLEQLLAKAVPRVVRVEQPGRAVLRLVRVLTAGSVVMGLALGGLLYQVFDLRRQLGQVTPGYWQHRYLQARAGTTPNHPLQQWLYQADTLYAGSTFAPTLRRLEDPAKTQPTTRTKARISRHK